MTNRAKLIAELARANTIKLAELLSMKISEQDLQNVCHAGLGIYLNDTTKRLIKEHKDAKCFEFNNITNVYQLLLIALCLAETSVSPEGKQLGDRSIAKFIELSYGTCSHEYLNFCVLITRCDLIVKQSLANNHQISAW